MGDRLTLETAGERELWRIVWLAMVDSRGTDNAPVYADDAVRAYRERLPASDAAPNYYIAFSAAAEAIHAAVSWLLELGADSTTHNAACIEKLAAHTVREYAVERAGDIGKPERGPTEGASDADTECECGPGARFDEAAQVCRECRRPLGEDAPAATSSPATPAPQVPDSPGWWWLDAFGDGKWAPVRVWRSASNSTLWTRRDVRLDEELVDAGDDWGGRCTRDAPDADLLALLGQAADELDRHDSNYHADSREFVKRLRTAIAAAKAQP